MQAKGRLQPWSSKGWRPEGLVAAAARKPCSSWRIVRVVAGGARDLEGCKSLKRLKPGNGKLECLHNRGLWQSRFHRRVLGVLGVLSVWRLANGRLECPKKRGLCAGKGQAAMLERWRPGAWWKLPRGMVWRVLRIFKAWQTMCRQRAGCNPGAAKADGQRAWWQLPRGSHAAVGRIVRVVAGGAVPHLRWRVLGVLGVLSIWRLANGRLECPNKRGLCAGKGQAAMLERWRPGAWWKLPRGMVWRVLRIFKAWQTMCRQRAGCNPGAAKADGQRAWWQLPRGSHAAVGGL